MSTRIFKQAPSTQDEIMIRFFDSFKPWQVNMQKKINSDSKPVPILVIDDDHAILTLMETYLQKTGFEVHTAASGLEAIGFYQRKHVRPAAVLLDVKMANLDGPQTFKRIREIDQLVPICFMTGDPGEYQTQDLLALGASNLLTKPLCLGKVAQIIRQLINPHDYGEVTSKLTSWSPANLVTSPFQ
ncbi:MAG TPA: response regulator [Gemmatales bacterium]|nr:response regulator [Gemmatales bacterium]